MIIGLTGQIGGGKTTAAKIFAELGATIVDADLIGRQVVEQSLALRKKLAKAFGAEILDAKGNIRRRKLAALAFRNRPSTDTLNELVHPYLLKELRRQVKAAGPNRLVVIDAALLLHWDMDREVDYVVVVHAGLQIRLNRLKSRGITRQDAVARHGAQLRYTEFRDRSDHLFRNHGTVAQLRRRIIKLLSKIAPQTD